MVLLARMFLWLIFYSAVGWLYESTLCSITGKKLVNRGFLIGPVCPIYGFGALVVIVALGENHGSALSLFLSGAMLACTLEYFTSWAMEKLFHARWWDYSDRPFHINGRVCLEGFVVFGLFSVVLLRYIHPWVEHWVEQIPSRTLYALSGSLFVVIAADVSVTVRHVLSLSGRLAEVQAQMDRFLAAAEQRGEQWVTETAEKFEHKGERWVAETAGKFEQRRAALVERFVSSEFYSERIASLMKLRKFQDIRLTRAFPRMKSKHYADALEALKKRLRADR